MCKTITMPNAERARISRVFNPAALGASQVNETMVSPPSGRAAATASSSKTPAGFRIVDSQVVPFTNFQQAHMGDRYFDTSGSIAARTIHRLRMLGISPAAYRRALR